MRRGPESTGRDVVTTAFVPSLAVLLAGSLLVGFSQGSWLLPIAAWVGPVFILRYARDRSGWRGRAAR